MKNIVVWGLGNHSIKNIIPVIHNSKSLNLYGICTRNRKVLDEKAKEYNCKRWESEELMLDDSNVEIVFLSTPIGLHAKQGMKILKSSKHLWCEKPFTSNINDTKKLASYADKNNLMIAEGFMYLYHPQFFEVKEIIQNQFPDGIISVNISFGIPFLDKPGFRMNKNLDGGAFWDVGTYPISAALSLFDGSSYEVLSSEIKFEKSFEIDISGSAKILIEDKVEITLHWAIGASYRNEIDVWGKNKSLYSDKFFSKPIDYIPKIEIRDKTGNIESKAINSANHFELMLEDFSKSIDDKVLMHQKRNEIIARSVTFDKIRNSNS